MENNFDHQDYQNLNIEPQRPQFLTVLCVLSFIWSGITLLFLTIMLIFSKGIFSFIDKILNGDENMPAIDEAQKAALETLLNLGPQKFMIALAFAIIIYMTSLLGVVKMWKIQRSGFYIYVAVNALMLVFNVISGSYFMGFVTLAFIGMYSVNLKHLR